MDIWNELKIESGFKFEYISSLKDIKTQVKLSVNLFLIH